MSLCGRACVCVCACVCVRTCVFVCLLYVCVCRVSDSVLLWLRVHSECRWERTRRKVLARRCALAPMDALPTLRLEHPSDPKRKRAKSACLEGSEKRRKVETATGEVVGKPCGFLCGKTSEDPDEINPQEKMHWGYPRDKNGVAEGDADYYCLKTFRSKFQDRHKCRAFKKLLARDKAVHEKFHKHRLKFVESKRRGDKQHSWGTGRKVKASKENYAKLIRPPDLFHPLDDYKKLYKYPISRENRKLGHKLETLHGVKGVSLPAENSSGKPVAWKLERGTAQRSKMEATVDSGGSDADTREQDKKFNRMSKLKANLVEDVGMLNSSSSEEEDSEEDEKDTGKTQKEESDDDGSGKEATKQKKGKRRNVKTTGKAKKREQERSPARAAPASSTAMPAEAVVTPTKEGAATEASTPAASPGKGGAGGVGRPQTDLGALTKSLVLELRTADKTSLFFGEHWQAQQRRLTRYIAVLASKVSTGSEESRSKSACQRKQFQVMESMIRVHHDYDEKRKRAELITGWRQMVVFMRTPPETPIPCPYLADIYLQAQIDEDFVQAVVYLRTSSLEELLLQNGQEVEGRQTDYFKQGFTSVLSADMDLTSKRAALKNVVSTVTNDKGLYHKSISEACEECEEVLRATVPVSTTEDQLKKRMEIVGKARDDSASIVGVLGLHMDGIALLKQADSITACRQHRVELKQKILDATATLSCSGGTLCSDMKGLEEQLGRLQHVRDQVSPLLAGVAEEEVLACELGPFLRNWAAHAETVGKSFMAVFVEFCTRRLDDPEADLCAEGDALALAAKALDEFQKDDRLQCLDVSRFTGAAKSWQETWPTIDLVIRGKVAELSQAQVQQLHNRDVVTFESLGVAAVSVKAFHQKYVEKVLDPTADALEQAMAKPLENLVGVFKKFSSTRVLAVPLLKETFKDVAESVFTEEFVSHATTLVEGVASKQLRCKIDGLRRWMLCCQAAVKLHVLSEEAQNLTVEGLSQETTNPLFQALSTLAEATRSNEQFVNAQEAASALDALSALVVAGLDVIVDFGAMHREVVRFYDESASMLFERWAASSAGLVRQLTAAMPSEKTLKEPNVITDDTLRKSVVDNPDKAKIPELIRQISLARAHVRSMEIMAKRPFFDPEPTSRTVKLAKVAVGVDYFLTELATRPATDAGMENWREAIKAKLKLKKITLPMFYYETLDKAEPRRPAPEGPAAPATQDVRPVPDVQAGVAATAEDVAAAAEPTPSVGQNID